MKLEQLTNMLSSQTDSLTTPYEFEDIIVTNVAVFAKYAHKGVYDKMGKPYYEHPFRVCKLVKERFGNVSGYTEKQINFACILALLHDVVEDTDWSAESICSELGLSEQNTKELIYGLSFVTHDKSEPYSLYIKKIAECPIIFPIWVKFCDLLDNSSLDRIIVTEGRFLTGEDTNRINRYLISIRILMKRLDSKTTNFVCDDEEIKTIDLFRTPSERQRMKKLENS